MFVHVFWRWRTLKRQTRATYGRIDSVHSPWTWAWAAAYTERWTCALPEIGEFAVVWRVCIRCCYGITVCRLRRSTST